MIETKITYFENGGPENTETTLKLAAEAAREQGIKNLVIATSSGRTPLALTDYEGLNVIVVTIVYTAEGTNPMSEETRETLINKGFKVCTAAHTLSGVERSFSTTFGGVYPTEVMAHTLRMVGRGTKVCVEISTMAADAGLVKAGESVVAVAGSGGGADTALILRPQVSSNILKTKVDRFICKQLD